MVDPTPLSVEHADYERAGLQDWEWRDGEPTVLVAGFVADDYTGAAAFALEVAKLADAERHHPDIDIRYQRHCRVALTTHRAGGVSDLDLHLAGAISELAASCGVGTEPTPR